LHILAGPNMLNYKIAISLILSLLTKTCFLSPFFYIYYFINFEDTEHWEIPYYIIQNNIEKLFMKFNISGPVSMQENSVCIGSRVFRNCGSSGCWRDTRETWRSRRCWPKQVMIVFFNKIKTKKLENLINITQFL
jgi:hypothetical protein